MKHLKSAALFMIAALFTTFILFADNACAEPVFPKLTGRVVDEANIIPPDIEAGLNQKLAQIEAESSDQIVVTTVNSLQGYEIEEYGYRLGRAWGIGQAKLNNGVLLIIAPKERKVRIEVGYGLEGNLTDALSSEIIQEKIVPSFKSGDMVGGIVAGVDGIDEVLKLSPEERASRAAKANLNKGKPKDEGVPLIVIIFIFIWILLMIRNQRRNRFYRSRGYDAGLGVPPIIFHDWRDNDRGGGFGGGFGGFGGGGGSFGGGGSSGSW